MAQTATAKFQVIGALVKMQTISLDEEIELIDGIPYDIDFYQDFSDICLNGQQITDMSVAMIIEFLNNNEYGLKTTDVNVPIRYTGEEYESRRDLLEALEKDEKKERKFEKKWEKGKAKRKAYMRRVLNWMDESDNLLKKRW